MAKAIKKWQKFEKLVAKIQTDFVPNAKITLNKKIIGLVSGEEREIDIFIEDKVGMYEIKIAVDCKDHKRPLDVKEVEACIGLMKEINPHIGVIVSASGFTKAALKVGQNAKLKLYKLIDTDDHEWKSEVALSAVCYVKNLSSFQLIFDLSGSTSLCIPYPVEEIMLYNSNFEEIGTACDLLFKWWENNNGNLSKGDYEQVHFLEDEMYIKSENNYCCIKITTNLSVEERIFYRNWPITNISGFEDQLEKGKVISKGFTLQNFNIEKLINNWDEIVDVGKLAIKPVIGMHIATICQL